MTWTERKYYEKKMWHRSNNPLVNLVCPSTDEYRSVLTDDIQRQLQVLWLQKNNLNF